MKKRRIILCASILAAVAATDPATACEVCYGQADSPWIDASKIAVGVMLAITVGVQACFAWFFLYLRRRSRVAHDPMQRPRLVKS
ncbi:MAG: hypothetical protein OEQ13_05945 [Acidobacteriota bacterium]|nr:hypothetical protein [Acidobacteriota bacterium]